MLLQMEVLNDWLQANKQGYLQHCTGRSVPLGSGGSTLLTKPHRLRTDHVIDCILSVTPMSAQCL